MAPSSQSRSQQRHSRHDVAASARRLLASATGRVEGDIDDERPLVDYGLSSSDAVVLTGQLEEIFGVQLPETLVWERPTLRGIAEYVFGLLQAAPSRAPNRARMPKRAGRRAVGITGMACRFPRAAGLDAFWQLLAEGQQVVRAVGEEHWTRRGANMEGVPKQTLWGGFLEQIDQFDAASFAISPREAERMDPQQRLLLEVASEALDDAGLAPRQLMGSNTGVFIGASTFDYGGLQIAELTDIDVHTSTGSALSILANRLSYVFDLRGPSLVVDTACSSSLVALHLALRSLRSGDCERAIVGGVNVILSPAVSLNFTLTGAMAADGRCKFMDSRADGYVRSEGAGIIVLERLDRAASSRRVYARIRGSAINQDGRSNGLMAPNLMAQTEVIQRAQRDARVLGAEIGYVEAHGTGTALGDPIEARALGLALRSSPLRTEPCLIGSVKTNLGHLEAAAGIAGLIKVVLSIHHDELPASLNWSAPNPRVPLAELGLKICNTKRQWPRSDGRAELAGISSFGFGGTNAHVIVEPPDARETQRPAPESRHPFLLPVAAASASSLAELAREYAGYLEGAGSSMRLEDICYSAAARREHGEHRLCVKGRTHEELASELRAKAARPVPRVRARPHVVFVFPGQGGQWRGMARELLASEPLFREAVMELEPAIRAESDFSVLDLLEQGAVGQDDPVSLVQPCLLAVYYGLSKLYRARGVVPSAVVGHSTGEVAAALVAGAIRIEDAARIVVRRSALLEQVRGNGAMAVVALTREEAMAELAGIEDRVSIAAMDAPKSQVLSGDPEAIDAVLARLTSRNVYCRRVSVSVASHSPQVEPLLPELGSALVSVQPRSGDLAFYSTVTGGLVSGTELGADYWVRNLRQPVRFQEAVERLVRAGHSLFLEIGPHPLLQRAMESCLSALTDDAACISSLERDEPAEECFYGSLAALYEKGGDCDTSVLYPAARVTSLPRRAWNRKRFWFEPSRRGADRVGPSTPKSPPRTLTPERTPRSDVENVLYQRHWVISDQTVYAPQGARALAAERWMIISDDPDAALALRSELDARGAQSQTLSTEAARGLGLRAAFDSGREPLKVLFLATGERERKLVSSDVPKRAREELDTLLTLVRALSERASKNASLWLVTQTALSPLDARHSMALARSALWGLGLSIQLERPQQFGGMIDVGSGPASVWAEAVIAAVVAPSTETQLCLVDGAFHAARLAHASAEAASPRASHFRAGGSYLITGGTGGVGLEIAEWLSKNGAQRVVLASRGGGNAAAKLRLGELRAAGTAVDVVELDVSDAAATRRLLIAMGPSVRGIFHAAGVSVTAGATETTTEIVDQVLRPKLDGSWNLHVLALELGLELDHFVMFGSAAAVWGAAQLSAYGAANAFLAGLAAHRRSLGLPALCVHFGWWNVEGLVTADAQRYFADVGLEPLESSLALRVLEHLLSCDASEGTIAAVDWGRFRATYELAARRRLFELLKPEAPLEVPRTTRPEAIAWTDRLKDLRPEQRLATLADLLKTEAGAVLRLTESALSIESGFFQLGMDSVMLVELRRRLEHALGITLSSATLFEHATIRDLATYLLHERLNVGGVEANEPANDLEPLSDDELIRRLEAKLESIG